MQSFTYTITEPVGIHARPAGLLVKEIKNYQSTVTVTVEGSDEDTTAPTLKQFFETNL